MTDPRNWKIHRNKRGWPRWYQRFLEAFWLLIGKWSLHKAWQQGMEHGTSQEYHRIITNMGEIESQMKNARKAEINLASK